MRLLQLIKNHRTEVLRIAAKHGAENVRLFGSVVRGEEGPESDIDLLVTAGPQRSAFFPRRVSIRPGRAIGTSC